MTNLSSLSIWPDYIWAIALWLRRKGRAWRESVQSWSGRDFLHDPHTSAEYIWNALARPGWWMTQLGNWLDGRMGRSASTIRTGQPQKYTGVPEPPERARMGLFRVLVEYVEGYLAGTAYRHFEDAPHNPPLNRRRYWGEKVLARLATPEYHEGKPYGNDAAFVARRARAWKEINDLYWWWRERRFERPAWHEYEAESAEERQRYERLQHERRRHRLVRLVDRFSLLRYD